MDKPDRRRGLQPRRTLINKYPRVFIVSMTTVCLLVFFSRPIYDAFIRTDRVPHPKWGPK